MRVGRLNLTVFSSALFCLGTIFRNASQALPEGPGIRLPSTGVLNLVRNDGEAALIQPKEADKPVAPIYSAGSPRTRARSRSRGRSLR